MTEEQYKEYIKNLETVCDMCRLTIATSLLFRKELVEKAEKILQETEHQIESLRQKYESPDQT